MNGYMRELNTRQKLRYLWDYYRIRIGLGVLAVIAVIAALAHMPGQSRMSGSRSG